MSPIQVAGASAVDEDNTRALSIVELRSFSTEADRILTRDEMETLRQELGTLRQIGAIIPGTGGLRKFRCGAKQRGKRGGARVIYFYGGDHMPIFLIGIYSKSEREDLSPDDKKAMRALGKVLQEEYRPKPVQPELKVVQVRRKGKRR